MDFFNNLIASTGSTSTTSITDIFIIIFETFILSLWIASAYKYTYKWEQYNHSYVQTLIILTVLIAVVMLIVWNNAAWAFTLMWALSIIRFRNSLKDIRDIWFILFAISIGMAMGTKLYLFALIATFIISGIFIFLTKVPLFYWEEIKRMTIKVRLWKAEYTEDKLKDIFIERWINFNVTSVNYVKTIEEDFNEVTYEISYKEWIILDKLILDIKSEVGNDYITITTINS